MEATFKYQDKNRTAMQTNHPIVLLLFILPVLGTSCFRGGENEYERYNQFHPGQVWLDNDSTHINAHGGGILVRGDTYYWFGEHKTAGRHGNRALVGIGCYSSKDLYNWTNEGIALAVSRDTASEIIQGCVMERPKVVYNETTGKYVMWFHLELKGQGYAAARTGLAVSDHVTGPYTYIRSFRPNAGTWPMGFTEAQKNRTDDTSLEWWTEPWEMAVVDGSLARRDFNEGQMSRDMTVYVDDDGKAYHVHASEENLTLHFSQLTEDYLDFEETWTRVLPAGHNEAPAIFKTGGKYYMITSGCTGWAPNAARLSVADHLLGPWEYLGNPCVGDGADLTFDSQSTFVLPVPGKKDAFIFMADRWKPTNPIDGRYIWLPIRLETGQPVIAWHDAWDLSIFDQ